MGLRHAITAGLRAAAIVGTALAGLGMVALPAQAQVDKAGGLGPPSNGSFFVPLIQKLQLDKKYGVKFDVNMYSDPATLYSDFAAGRTSHIYGAFFNAGNFYNRGMDVRLLFTIATNNLGFITKNPAIKNPPDLKGKTVAATTSSGFYGLSLLFLRQNGLDPRKNLNVISASPPAVTTQLLADKVDVGLLSDPGLSNLVGKGFHMVGDMNTEIRKALGMAPDAPVWFIGAYAHKSWIDENPQRALATMKMFQEAAAYHKDHPDEADKIVSDYTKIPLPALKLSRKLGLTYFQIEPAIAQKANLDATYRGLKEVGFLDKVPDDGLYYDWASAKK